MQTFCTRAVSKCCISSDLFISLRVAEKYKLCTCVNNLYSGQYILFGLCNLTIRTWHQVTRLLFESLTFVYGIGVECYLVLCLRNVAQANPADGIHLRQLGSTETAQLQVSQTEQLRIPKPLPKQARIVDALLTMSIEKPQQLPFPLYSGTLV